MNMATAMDMTESMVMRITEHVFACRDRHPNLKTIVKDERKKALQNQNGLTLLEIIFVIVIFAIISVFIGQILNSGTQVAQNATGNDEGFQLARLALQRIVREVRQLKNENSILSAVASSLQFIDLDDNQITIAYAAGKIAINNDIVAENVTSFSFEYYNKAGSELSAPVGTPSSIWTIKINQVLQTQERTISLSTFVFPRNLSEEN